MYALYFGMLYYILNKTIYDNTTNIEYVINHLPNPPLHCGLPSTAALPSSTIFFHCSSVLATIDNAWGITSDRASFTIL